MAKPLEIEVFRVGTHPSSTDEVFHFPTELVDEAIENYNPNLFRAPLIVSHETGAYSDRGIVDSELAFGIADSFRRSGEKVFATFNKYAPEVKHWINEGRINSVSSSFYLPESTSNPTPGKLAFRHVALLGKNAPAVKGMAPLELGEMPCFSDKGIGIAIFSMPFGEPFLIISRLFRALRDQSINANGLEKSEAIYPSETILALENMANTQYVTTEYMETSFRFHDSQMKELWEMLARCQHEMSRITQESVDANSSPLSASHAPSTSAPYATYKESKMKRNYSGAMAAIAKKDSAMSDVDNFMKAMGLEDSQKPDAVKMLAGSMEIPEAFKKKLAKALSMSDAELKKLYVSDEEINMSEEQSALDKVAELQSQNAALMQELVEQRAGRRTADITSFVEGEQRAGRVTPGIMRPQTISFGDGKSQTYDLVSFMASLNDAQLGFMKKHLTGLPSQIEYSEVVTEPENTVTNAPLNYAQIGDMAKQLVKAERAGGKEITEAQAVDRVMTENGVRF